MLVPVFAFFITMVLSVNSNLTTSFGERACPGRQTFTCEGGGMEITWSIGNEFILSLGPLPSNQTITQSGISATVTFSVMDGHFMSTLSTIITTARAGSVIRCFDIASEIGNKTIEFALPPSQPTSITTVSETGSRDLVEVTLRWDPPDSSGGVDISHNTVTISPPAQLSATVVTSTSVTVAAADYNVDYTVSVVATNCAGNSTAEEYMFRVGGCPLLTDPMNGAFGQITSRTTDSTVTVQCDPGYMSEVDMVTCEGTLMWSPDPGTVVCSPLTQPPPTTAPPMDCTAPLAPPLNGSVSDHSVPAVPGTRVTFQCDVGLFPTDTMNVTCLASGEWDRNPGDIVCRREPVSCVLPDRPLNSLPLNTNTRTSEGSVIWFQCEPGFSLEGGGTVTCNNSALWSPDPALIMCTSLPVSVDIAPIAGGVVGGLIVVIVIVLIVIFLIVFLIRRDKGVKGEETDHEDAKAPVGPTYEEVGPALPPREVDIELQSNQAYGQVVKR